MASQGAPTRGADGIELTTLFLSAVASAAAAYITSKIWAPGTLFSAAMSPVIVALVKEGLRKPTEKVVEVVPVVVPSRSRWTRTGAGEAGLVPAEPQPPAPAAVSPDAPHVVLPPVVATDHGPVNVYSTRGRRLRWRVAVITGLLGFGVCVLLFTVPELIAGESIGRGSGHATTIFGGGRSHKSSGTTSTTKTTSTTSTTPDKTTTTPGQTTTTEQPSRSTPATPSPATPSTAAPAAPSSAAPAPTTSAPDGTASPQPAAPVP